MELDQQIIEQTGLTEDQVKAVTGYYSEQIPNLKKEWDGKANENAERIVEGAISSTIKEFGLEIKRGEGEKNKDFLARVNKTVIEKEKESVNSLKSEYEIKLKEFKGGDALKSELDDVKKRLDQAQQKSAQFDEWSENDYKGKFEETTNKLTEMSKRVSFAKVKPKFPDTVNPYELNAKWKEFETEIDTKYILSLDSNDEPICIDRENSHSKKKLADLVKENETVQSLMHEYQPNGLGAKVIKIEGLPFSVKEGENVTTAIDTYLTSKGLRTTSQEYGIEYQKLWKAYREKTPNK